LVGPSMGARADRPNIVLEVAADLGKLSWACVSYRRFDGR
jgi:hypothetical protein